MTDEITWTGTNGTAVEKFAENHGFFVSVGANFYKPTRWYHRFFDYLLRSFYTTEEEQRRAGHRGSAFYTALLFLSEPRHDRDVLEVHPRGVTFDMPEQWKAAKVGDHLTHDGTVIAGRSS